MRLRIILSNIANFHNNFKYQANVSGICLSIDNMKRQGTGENGILQAEMQKKRTSHEALFIIYFSVIAEICS